MYFKNKIIQTIGYGTMFARELSSPALVFHPRKPSFVDYMHISSLKWVIYDNFY